MIPAFHRMKGGGPTLCACRSGEPGPFSAYGKDQEPEEADRGGLVTVLSSRPGGV